MASDIVTDRPRGTVTPAVRVSGAARRDKQGRPDAVGAAEATEATESAESAGPLASLDGTAVPAATAAASAPAAEPVATEPPAAPPRRSWIVRAVLAVVGSLVDDLTTFFSRPVRLVREKHLRAIPGTIASVTLIALFAIIQHFRPAGIHFVNAVAGVHQGEPLWEVLLQLPLSMFAPAPMLPAWGAMLQVFVAFGISECWLGWRKMLAVAVLTSAVTSMAARLMVAISSHWSIGTPEIDNWQLDTGPSVGVVALLIYLALRLRTYWIVALTAVTMGGEAALLPNLAGREHLVAISLGVITYFLLDLWWPAWQRRRARSAGAS
jgi:hypothetical protein